VIAGLALRVRARRGAVVASGPLPVSADEPPPPTTAPSV
jgi:hypothetical protein